MTIDRQTISLSPFFTVFATQNPVEYEGTYPLPEAQKDRFMMKIVMTCPSQEEEVALARRMLGRESPEAVLAAGAVQKVIGIQELAALRQALESIAIRDELLAYIVELVRATRRHENILLGAGPRATQALLLASRAQAALLERDFVTPDDIKLTALPILEHRLILRPEFERERVSVTEVIQKILRTCQRVFTVAMIGQDGNICSQSRE